MKTNRVERFNDNKYNLTGNHYYMHRIDEIYAVKEKIEEKLENISQQINKKETRLRRVEDKKNKILKGFNVLLGAMGIGFLASLSPLIMSNDINQMYVVSTFGAMAFTTFLRQSFKNISDNSISSIKEKISILKSKSENGKNSIERLDELQKEDMARVIGVPYDSENMDLILKVFSVFKGASYPDSNVKFRNGGIATSEQYEARRKKSVNIYAGILPYDNMDKAYLRRNEYLKDINELADKKKNYLFEFGDSHFSKTAKDNTSEILKKLECNIPTRKREME